MPPKEKDRFCNSQWTWYLSFLSLHSQDINKQSLDEFEHDIMNYQNQGLSYLMEPKAEACN